MTPSIGMVVGVPIAVLVIVASVTAGVLVKRHQWDTYDREPARWFALGLMVAVPLVVTVITLGTTFPWTPRYHVWRTTSGTIQTISSRIIPSGDHSVEQRFAVTFTDGRQRACDDTRCTLLRPGDQLTLTCKAHWQWAGTPGYDCNYVSSRRRG